jgi:hypothetical protein
MSDALVRHGCEHTIVKWIRVTLEGRVVIATLKEELQGLLEPRLFGVPLRLAKSVKYLGVILDSRLTFKEHVEAKVRKTQNLLWAC